jgi:hypothetical protein
MMAGPPQQPGGAPEVGQRPLVQGAHAQRAGWSPLAHLASGGDVVAGRRACGHGVGGRRAGRHPGNQHRGERDGGRGDERGDQQGVPGGQPAQPGGEDQPAALADAQRGLQPAEARVPLRPGVPLHDEQVGDRNGPGEPGAVGQPEQRLQRGGGQREQPERRGAQGRAGCGQAPVRAVPVGQVADHGRADGPQAEGTHDQADVTYAVPDRDDRQQDRHQAHGVGIDERERGKPGLEGSGAGSPGPAAHGQASGRHVARAGALSGARRRASGTAAIVSPQDLAGPPRVDHRRPGRDPEIEGLPTNRLGIVAFPVRTG